MIVKMKKITLLLSAKDKEKTLVDLRKLGVLHVHHIKNPVSEDIQFLENEIDNVHRALQVAGKAESSKAKMEADEAPALVENILNLSQRREALARELEEHSETHKWFETWGAISYASLQKLKQAGIFVRFYVAEKSAFKKVDPEKNIHLVREKQNTVHFALFSDSAEEHLDFKEELCPPVELSELDAQMSQVRTEIERVSHELAELSNVSPVLNDYLVRLQKRLELSQVRDGMGDMEEIAYMQGFCPVDSVAGLENMANENGLAYVVDDPDDPADVPTLTSNPKPIRIIKPLFDFMGTLPGYNEQDVSFVFLFFFSVFFAILIGDAGYGLVFLLTTMFFAHKKKNAPREPFFLMYVLSGTTIIWGIITGTWFGAESIARLPFFNMFIINKIDSFASDNQVFLMYLTFIIGAIHLSVARALAAAQKIKSPTAIAEIGWIFILWGLFFVAGNLVLGKDLPGLTYWLFITGSGLVIIFANFQKNIFKGILLSLGNLPLDIISSFSDVVSYLRLFAVGYATVVVAASFNNMALGNGIGSVVAGISAALILVLGHTLNIILGMLAVIVHGVRLNMLEFSGQIGMQWSGKPYEPFKE